jgi:RNase P subunit RPR2
MTGKAKDVKGEYVIRITMVVECKRCGWGGKEEEALIESFPNDDYKMARIDIYCPNCKNYLVSYLATVQRLDQLFQKQSFLHESFFAKS